MTTRNNWPDFFDLEEVPIPKEPTWDDIIARSRTCAVLYQVCALVDSGRLTKEQALIRVALLAANDRARQIRENIKTANETIPRRIFLV